MTTTAAQATYTVETDFTTKTDRIEHGSIESARSDFALMVKVAKATREVVTVQLADNTSGRIMKTWTRA